MRPRLVWLVTLPLTLAGSELGHAAVNALLGAPTEHGGELLEGSGPRAELILGLVAAAFAIVLLGLAWRVLGAWTSGRRGVPAMPFACLAPTVFVLQEHLERFLDTGAVPLGTILEPTFLPGLAIQVPFAVAAYLIARALLRAADVVRALIASRPQALATSAAAAVSARPRAGRPRGARRTWRHSGRAPPIGLAAAD